MNNEKIQKIKPSGIFTNYIFKSIPLAFDESMSYYETLLGVLNLLKSQEEIINNNADVIIELENYVNDYFKNLDVQEEINNKLDEMAESGQLTDIIAQYIQLAGLLSYNTLNDMKLATNLTNGSSCIVLGKNNINDGLTELYKVRQITNQDIVDNIKIIALQDNNLVAELIPNKKGYANALTYGCDNTGDLTKGTQNSTIVNNLLNEGKIVFFPSGIYQFDQPLIVKNGSGLIGEDKHKTTFRTNNEINLIECPVSIDDIDNVYSIITLQNFTLIGNYGLGCGIKFYNYTFEVTCNNNPTDYQALKGDNYACEFRCSKINNIYIADFATGIKTGMYVALLTLSNLFIAHCDYAGIDNIGTSDSIFDNINITFCLNGMIGSFENDKLSNINIYMNGKKDNGTQTEIDNSKGLHLYGSGSHYTSLVNVMIQENGGNGIVFDSCHDIILSNVIADANGFDSEINNIGFLFFNAYNIIGSIMATNKNSNITQRLGAYCNEGCYNFNVEYRESNQQEPLKNAGMHTYNLFKKDKIYKVITPHDEINNVDVGKCWYDGQTIHIAMKFNVSGDITANTKIADIGEIYQYVRDAGTTIPQNEFYAVSGNQPVPCYMNNDGSIYAGGNITSPYFISIEYNFDPYIYV